MRQMGRTTRIAPYRSRRPRSSAQKTQLRNVHASRHTEGASPEVDKENDPKLCLLEQRCSEYKRQGRNDHRQAARALKTLAAVHSQAKVLESEAHSHAKTMTADVISTRSAIQDLQAQLGQASKTINGLRKKNHRLAMRLSRAPAQKALAVKKALVKNSRNRISVKDKGIIKDHFRDLVRDLVSEGVGVKYIDPIVKRVSNAVGVEVAGDISTRSVGRIVLEGGEAAKMQIVDHIQSANSMWLWKLFRT